MKKFNELLEYHLDNGFWSSANDNRYGYLLSPEPFFLDANLQSQLVDIGKVVCEVQKGARKLFDLSLQKSGDHFASSIQSLFKQASGGLPTINPSADVPLTKVDLMIDKDSNIKIAEIDSYNPRGIAYALLLRDIFEGGNCTFYRGGHKILEDYMDANNTETISWIYAEKERYYINAFEQFKRIMSKNNRNIVISSARQFSAKTHQLGLIVPWGMNNPSEILGKESIIDEYRKNPKSFLYPLVPWLGTKALLGIASNASSDHELEEMVAENFNSLPLIRNYIPPSSLVGKRNMHQVEKWMEQSAHLVLKGNVASGLKSVYFSSSDNQQFKQNLDSAFKMSKASYIMQEEVEQKQFTIPYFGKNGESLVDKWYVRLIVHVDANGNIVDAEMTGRKTPDVHGAPDCIMAPCVI